MKHKFEGLISFIKTRARRRFTRLHVPGHQGGCSFLNRKFAARFDITEIEGADWLFESSGLLNKLEQRLANLFGQSAAISTCGSTLCLQTMVALCKNKTIVAHRNSAHVSFFNVCSILGVEVHWFGCCDSFGLNSFDLTEIEQILVKHEKASCAVYFTSPDYFGMFAPVNEILKICKKFDALCLVDCAHGAHLNFTKFGPHPASLGVDLCCSSLHKTLPALTGAAVLNFNEKLFSKARVKSVMSMFSTTSPSYLTMASIEFCVYWLERFGVKKFLKLYKKKKKLVKNLQLPFLKTDVAKLVVDCRKLNFTGLDLAAILRSKKLEPEFSDENFVCMVISPFLSFFDWFRLKRCLKNVEFNSSFEFRNCCSFHNYSNHKIKNKEELNFNSFFDLLNRKTEMVKLNEKNLEGRVCAKTKFKSPPGTVIVAAGEVLNLSSILNLKRNGETEIEVFC